MLHTYPYGPDGAEIREYVDLEPAPDDALQAFFGPSWQEAIHRIFVEETRLIPEIEFAASTGRILSIAALLPPRFLLLRLPEWCSSVTAPLPNRVRTFLVYGSYRLEPALRRGSVPQLCLEEVDFFASPGAMAVLLHEIGHAWRTMNDSDGERTEANRLLRFRRAPRPGSTRWYGYLTYVLQRERDAWADALRTLRGLRELGVDVEPELRTSHDVFRYAHRYLETYEWELRTRENRATRVAQFEGQDARAILRESIRPRRILRSAKKK